MVLARKDVLSPKTRDLALDFFAIFSSELDSQCTVQLLRVTCEILETRMIAPMTAAPRIIRWIEMHTSLRQAMQDVLNNFTDTSSTKLLLQRLFVTCPALEAYIHSGTVA